jgi:glycosidase
MIGEIWHEATQFVGPGEFDGLTHFPFWAACRSFFALGEIDAQGFNDRLTRARIPYQEQAVLWDVLGTHDTPRFLTDCRGDARRLALALIVQMTYPGTPHIYYGDEVGLTGGADPGCRACMEWDRDRQRTGQREQVRRLIALRRAHSALRAGSCTVVSAEPGRRLFAYFRRTEDDLVLVAVQAGRRPATLTVTTDLLGTVAIWQDALGGARYVVGGGVLTVSLSSWGGVVLCPA